MSRESANFKPSGELRLAFFLLALSMGAAGCAVPIAPGCRPGESLPEASAFLRVGVLAETEVPAWKLGTAAPQVMRWGSNVLIDRAGRSQFSPDATAYMMSTVAVCRTISGEDVLSLENAWKQVAHDPSAAPAAPFLYVQYYAGDELPEGAGEPVGLPRRLFYAKPGEVIQRPDLEHAVSLTLTVLERTYRKRFVRELRAADLQDLLQTLIE